MNKKKIFDFLKSEIVTVISFLLAVASMFFVPLNREYINYIDFRTLALLFGLMTVMAGLNRIGLFKISAEKLLSKVRSVRSLTLTLVLICFFLAMVITNDVVLITFVPFTVITLKMAKKLDRLIYITVLETAAANLGSMLTPIGNPQNLYLFSTYNMSISSFLKTLFPYALLSLISLVILSLFSGKEKITVEPDSSEKIQKPFLILLYTVLFIIALLSVFRILHFVFLLVAVLIFTLIFDKDTLKTVDYTLLLTFVFLFVFIGNLGNIKIISNFLSNIVAGNEVTAGILLSQIFSNVPAAILLSGFTSDGNALLIGTNLGGLGTLIASMASLISFKFIQKGNIKTGKYILIFTVVNVILLVLNLILYCLL